MKQADRFIQIRRVLMYVLALNWLNAFIKIIYGIITRCASMSADGMHSLADGASNIIGLIGIWVAAQPVDKGHPYGHKKYETFSAMGIAILLILLCAQILHEAFNRFRKPVIPVVTNISFCIMFFTFVINLFVMWYEVKKSKALKSDILYSDAMHTRSDIFVSLSVVATLVSIKMGLPIIDTLVAVVIAALIAYAAFEILRDSSNILCDRAPIVSDMIRDICLEIEGVKECHRIRTRGRPDDIHVDLHVVVNPNMHVGTAHNITEVIEKVVRETITGVTDVVVHIEPK
ncbi:MAG: cation diffusion facilitator family transporter [Candidatus Omnitrophica bacterium]|nr:cation diffusion facilitator family transporter [Candidatus Omnitrophota bacterium]